VATSIILLVGAICILGVIFSPWLVGLVTQGWVRTAPEKYQQAVLLTQIMFPFLLLVALAAQPWGFLTR